MVAPKTSKAATAWWLASKLTNVPLAMKCLFNNQKKQSLRNAILDRLGKTDSALPTTLQLHFFALHKLDWGPALDHGDFFWHLALTTSTAKISRLRQDNDNVESFSSSGSVVAATSLNPWPRAATRLVCPILLTCNCSQTHWHPKFQGFCFSKSQYLIKHRQIGR